VSGGVIGEEEEEEEEGTTTTALLLLPPSLPLSFAITSENLLCVTKLSLLLTNKEH